MNDEGLRQRIAYLVTHGGLYPDDRRWPRWAVVIAVLQVVIVGVLLLTR